MREIDTVIIHCLAHETAGYKHCLNWHTDPKPKGNGWDDIGYHGIIENGGKFIQGRPIQIPGAHCKEYNSRSVGYGLAGLNNFDFKQLHSLRNVIYNLEVLLGKKLKIKCHYEYNPGKTCPNINADLLREFMRCDKYLERKKIYDKMEV